jgi:hypothetical protein
VTIAKAERLRLHLGRVFVGAFAVVRRYWWLLLLLAIGLDWAPSIIVRALPLPHANSPHSPTEWAIAVGWRLFYTTLYGLYLCLVTQVALDALAGRPVHAARDAQAAVVAVPVLLPFLLVLEWRSFACLFWRPHFDLTTTLYLLWGDSAFNLVLTAFWGVIVPVIVAEQTDVFAGSMRSTQLLHRGRWTLLGLVIAYTVLSSVPFILAPFILVRSGLTCARCDLLPPIPVRMRDILQLPGELLEAAWIVVVAGYYRELRRLRHGVDPDALDAVFD